MSGQKTIVVTTIQHPTASLRRLAALRPDWRFVVVGDRKAPEGWHLPGTEFVAASAQASLGRLAALLPFNHYARKNIGYVLAIREQAEAIYETDDDNTPYEHLLAQYHRRISGRRVAGTGWENVYRHFSDARIWPRGYPLECVNDSFDAAALGGEPVEEFCPVQQFLSDGDPDVDAVYRLTKRGEVRFGKNEVLLGRGSFCPFNSQNTLWWPEAYPLLYLPSHASFRMTDIWRSFVAIACLHAADMHVAYRSATAYQIRNAHDLMRDFRDELPGYLHNRRIMALLASLPLSPTAAEFGANLRLCYATLVEHGVLPDAELELVDAWLEALIGNGSGP